MNDVNLFNDSTNIRHSKLPNNPNVLHEEGKVDSIELVEDGFNKNVPNNINQNIYESIQEKIKNDNIIKDENNIYNEHTNDDNIEKIDEESINSNNSYVRRESYINKSYENNMEKSLEDIKDVNEWDIKEDQPKNDLIIEDDENNNSKVEKINNIPQGMNEKNINPI